jgi:hypothetical protein
MLVKAAAAGIDIAGIVGGLNQPLGPTRAAPLIQKAIEIGGEVRALGGALLAALEKKDAEALSLLRQRHEIGLQELMRDVRFLQWKEAEEATRALRHSWSTAYQRYRHHQLLLGKEEDGLPQLPAETPGTALTAETFDAVYEELVGKYAHTIALDAYSRKALQGAASPLAQAGGEGHGLLYLIRNEHEDLDVHMPASRDLQDAATAIDAVFGVLGLIPNLGVDAEFMGIGMHMEFGGPALAQVGRILSGIVRAGAEKESYAGLQASKTAGYERRADDWVLQSNLAARELMQIGRQIIASLIREQVARHECENLERQIERSREVDAFLREKFTGEELYGWMQGELSRLYYEYYKLAFDVARKAEQTMKRELMRPELDAMSFVRFNYWDGGRRGLLAGEALHLDLKRMELAYLDHDKREYELTRHVSLRQLDPLALLALKATGACEFTVPEWLFDLDCPGHYLRRLKSVALSIPAVVGPYTSVNCTLSLQRSSVRRSPFLAEGRYARGPEDGRFVDYSGTIQSIVTSGASSDPGVFEANLRDERFLPFEGAGACGTWRLELPGEFRQFDYDTISDVVLHLRYTARPGGGELRSGAVARLRELVETAGAAGLARLFSLRHDFPSEWYRFATGEEALEVRVRREQFPYFVQGREIRIDALELYAIRDGELRPATPAGVDAAALTAQLHDDGECVVSLAPDGTVLVREDAAVVFLVVRYSLG